MILPDCRTDENYNEKYLNEKDKEYIAGYDWAVKEIATFFANLDVYPEVEDILADNKAVIVEGKAEKVEEAIKDWLESSRDELITAILDEYSEEEYEKLKAKADGGIK